MTAAVGSWTEARALYEQLDHATEMLGCAIYSGDLLTASYAAAQVSETTELIETALVSIETAGRRARFAIAH
jgi:hypothetical protein